MSDKGNSNQPKKRGGWRGSPESLKNLRGNHANVPQEEAPEDATAPAAPLFDRHHRDVIWVYNHPTTQTAHPVRKQLQKEFKGDFKSFWAKVEKARAYFAGTPPDGDEPKWDAKGSLPCPICERMPEGPDEGTERALDLCEELLLGFHEKMAAEDTELAKRPDAASIGASLKQALNASLERERIQSMVNKDLRERVRQLGGNTKA